MGFFGSSHKTYYNSSSTFLFTETPSLLTQTIRGAVLENRNIADDLKTNLMFGIGYKANALYKYGQGEYPWGLPEGTAVTYGSTSPTNIKISIERELNEKVYVNSTQVDVSGSGEMYYTATYYLLDALGEVITDELYTWVYYESSGVYPYLNLKLNDVQAQSQYYPIIPIRVDNVDYTDSSHENHEEVKRACNYLGIDAVNLASEIADANEDDGNPTEDAHVVLAVNISDDTEVGKLYLYQFFEHQLNVSTSGKEDYEYWKDNYIKSDGDGGTYFTEDPPYNTIRVEDSTFKLELSWLYITQEIVEGNLGLVGTCTRGYKDNYRSSANQSRYFSVNTYWIRKQVSATQYSELTVHGLTFSNWAVGKEIRTTLAEAFEEDPEVVSTFCIPLRKDLVKTLGPLKTHDLMYRSIRLVVSDKNRVKLKWYQTGLFKFAMLVVAVVVSFYNLPAGVSIFSATAAVSVVVQLLLTQLMLPAVVSAVSDVLGEELAIIVSMVAAFYIGGGSLESLTASTSALVSAGFTGINKVSAYITSTKLESISDSLEEIQEEIADLLSTQAETARETQFAVNVSKSDSYALMDPTTYVTKTLREPLLPTLVGYTVSNYTDIMRYMDMPKSNIRLGNTLT